jgi:hypothetical protein
MFENTVFLNCSFSNTKVYFSHDITTVYNTSVFEYNSIQYIKVFEKNFGWDQSARAGPVGALFTEKNFGWDQSFQNCKTSAVFTILQFSIQRFHMSCQTPQSI